MMLTTELMKKGKGHTVVVEGYLKKEHAASLFMSNTEADADTMILQSVGGLKDEIQHDWILHLLDQRVVVMPNRKKYARNADIFGNNDEVKRFVCLMACSNSRGNTLKYNLVHEKITITLCPRWFEGSGTSVGAPISPPRPPPPGKHASRLPTPASRR